jgi:type VI protein secretion system component VasF
MTRYFRNAKGFSGGEKTEISATGAGIADKKRHRKVFFIWMMFAAIIVAVVLCAVFFL